MQRSTLTHADGTLLRNGQPHRVLAGSLHYFRVHPGHWADRLRRLAALGLNTVDTYVPWNFHERTRGDIRFDGPRDLDRFVRLAQAEGLDVVVRPGPYICAEFWNGWFDHWGEKHHVRSAASAAEDLDGILDEGGSVSLYMAHGGTNFGLWAGANHDGDGIQPTVTSYDSDAPIAENGALTPKFFALRDRLTALDGAAPRLPLPADPPLLAPRELPVTPHAGLLDALRAVSEPVAAPLPPSFEELSLASGMVLYEAEPLLPPGDHEVTVTGLHDRAQVFVDDTPVAVLDRESASFTVSGTGARVRLALLVENQGRINYGPLLGQGKGILGGVRVERRLVHGWTSRPLPLDAWTPRDTARAMAAAPSDGRAGFATAVLSAAEPADTFVALPGFGKGFLWVNDTLLGRYWEIGPQTTLYLPGPLLRPGDNTLTVLELERLGDRLALRDRAGLGPSEEYVETFD